MLAVKGIIQGNMVVIDNEDIKAYDGKDVIVTILDFPYNQMKKTRLNLDEFVKPTERGQDADKYVKELRENDRLEESIY